MGGFPGGCVGEVKGGLRAAVSILPGVAQETGFRAPPVKIIIISDINTLAMIFSQSSSYHSACSVARLVRDLSPAAREVFIWKELKLLRKVSLYIPKPLGKPTSSKPTPCETPAPESNPAPPPPTSEIPLSRSLTTPAPQSPLPTSFYQHLHHIPILLVHLPPPASTSAPPLRPQKTR